MDSLQLLNINNNHNLYTLQLQEKPSLLLPHSFKRRLNFPLEEPWLTLPLGNPLSPSLYSHQAWLRHLVTLAWILPRLSNTLSLWQGSHLEVVIKQLINKPINQHPRFPIRYKLHKYNLLPQQSHLIKAKARLHHRIWNLYIAPLS